jgi:acetyl esterase/lipase
MSRRAALASLAALMGSACTQIEFLAANVPAAIGPYKRKANIAYGKDPQHRLDVYIPGKPGTAPPPLVVFWHGGRWSYGDKTDYLFVGAALAQLGYVAVLPNYRHYPQVKMAGFMDDAALAALWAATNAETYGADPNRLYLMGHSAGAHMAALVTLDERYFAAAGRSAPRIAGIVGLSGPYDFLPLREQDVQTCLARPNFTGNRSPSISCAPAHRPCCWCMACGTIRSRRRIRAISRPP